MTFPDLYLYHLFEKRLSTKIIRASKVAPCLFSQACIYHRAISLLKTTEYRKDDSVKRSINQMTAIHILGVQEKLIRKQLSSKLQIYGKFLFLIVSDCPQKVNGQEL